MLKSTTTTRNRSTTTLAIVAAIAAIAAIAGPATAARGAASSVQQPSACTITPEPDAMPDSVTLGSVKVTGDGLAVLHRVDCDGRTVGWKWLTPRDILTP
jgi:hypothetical protein